MDLISEKGGVSLSIDYSSRVLIDFISHAWAYLQEKKIFQQNGIVENGWPREGAPR